MLNIIQLLNDEGLGHCVRMITFAKKISSPISKTLILVNEKRKDQVGIIAAENLDFVAYDTNVDIKTLYSSVIKNHKADEIKSWSIDTKKNCVEIVEYLKKKKFILDYLIILSLAGYW